MNWKPLTQPSINMSGRIVETKSGRGQTHNEDKPVNGKIPVYLENGGKVLCDPSNIKIIGYWDGTGTRDTPANTMITIDNQGKMLFEEIDDTDLDPEVAALDDEAYYQICPKCNELVDMKKDRWKHIKGECIK